MIKIAVVLGTRPEIVKMSPVIRQLENKNIEYFILHSGQHYSSTMSQVFFQQLKLPSAKYNVSVGSGHHGEQTGKMLIAIERILLDEHPDLILVEGDTNTVLASALAAAKVSIGIAQVEAGARSFDRSMPEEINRVLTDHLSDVLFAPTAHCVENLRMEGIHHKNVHMVGSTLVDAVHEHIRIAMRMKADRVPACDEDYLLATIHRPENVDDRSNLENIFRGLRNLSEKLNTQILIPTHPRTKKNLAEFGTNCMSDLISILDPLDYFSFLRLESSAKLILTDSGGVQEEACILKVPCVTLRRTTEWIETIEVGANMIAGTNPNDIVQSALVMIKKARSWNNPLGDGHAGLRIAEILLNRKA
jgi:UDP-N-acetylglucosamine 2-epimerase (non-hydrolysing)